MRKLLIVYLILCIIHESYGVVNKKRIPFLKNKKTNAGRVKLAANKVNPNFYDPKKVDWRGVMSGCRAACDYEKRLCNFYIRAAAHDSMSISESLGGADGSLLLTDDELRRIENNHDNFAYIVSKNALSLARKYDASVADVIAVCGAVASKYLGGPDIIMYNENQPFMVGRIDKTEPNPANSLAPANMNTSSFTNFATKRNLTIEEMTALMGTHSLVDAKGCLNKDGTYCDPNINLCNNVSMFTLDNSYYNDVCTTEIEIYPENIEKRILKNRTFEVNAELCKFTSNAFREDVKADVEVEIESGDTNGMFMDSEFTIIETIKENIRGLKTWLFTVHDGWMGMACRNELMDTPYNREIGSKMRKFQNNRKEWDIVYTRAYKKMVNIGATWSGGKPYPITGRECNSGYVSNIPSINCKWCNVNYKTIKQFTCHQSCYCSTAFKLGEKFYF